MISKRLRHISRYQEIATALFRHGLGQYVTEIGFSHLLSIPQRLFRTPSGKEAADVGTRLRYALQDLGPTFVKLGQVASTRTDMIPDEIIRELVKLQDQVMAFPYEDVRQTIEEELGGDIHQIFFDFNETELAAASIGQVHRAILNSGEEVAVKVQRPHIIPMIETDLEILQDIATLAEHRYDWAKKYQIRDVVDEFTKTLHSELDYTIEGRNTEKIGRQFAEDPQVYIPKVFWELSTKKVLTMEYVEGVKLDDPNKLIELGYQPEVLAERLAKAIFHQIFIEGFFHGDPHPGNVLVLPGQVIAFVDFGMAGYLTPEMKYNFSSLVIALMRQNTDGIIKAIFSMGVVPDDVNMAELRRDVEQLRLKYVGKPLSQISLGEAITELFNTAFHHSIQIPSDFTMLGKTILTVEGLVERLDPDVSILDLAEPFGRKLLQERFNPKHMAENLWHQASELGEVLLYLPQNINELTSMVKQGRLSVKIQIPKFDPLLRKLDRITNQLSFSIVLMAFSIIMAAVIIGSAMGRQNTVLWQIPAIEIGLGAAAVMFLFLLYSIFRSGRF